MLAPIVLDIKGCTLDEDDRRRILHPYTGMVILFTRNYENPTQLKALCDEIHALKPGIMIAVDHEGGRVQRFREGFTAIPSMRTFGQLWIDDPEDAVRRAIATGYVMGAELRACGVDMTFAPCLDIDFGRSSIIGHRAFAQNPKTLTHLALAISQGLRMAGMPNCGKHFPGHGWVEADSHLELPVDDRAIERLFFADLKPYRWMGSALDSVMVAHVVYPKIDPNTAGFSSHWIGKVLREQLKFGGCVFSDDLCMKGAVTVGGIVDRANVALNAGCDALIVCNDFEASDELLEGLKWEETPEFVDHTSSITTPAPFMTREQLAKTTRYQEALKLVPTESVA